MDTKSVLFLCIHNSARSQIAEAFLKKHGGDKFEVESAGLEKGTMNPVAVKSMMEVGIDISKNKTKDVDSFYRRGKSFDFIITVCDAKNSERCPVFPGKNIKLAWDFPDPSEFTGTPEEKLDKIRTIRNEIEKSVLNFIKQYS